MAYNRCEFGAVALGACLLANLASPTFAAEAYDTASTAKATDVVPADLLRNPLFKIGDPVVLSGPQYRFSVSSEFGRFSVQGQAMLRRAAAEISALEQLKSLTSGKAFTNSVAQAVGSTIGEVAELLAHPVDTVTGIPKGLVALVKASQRTLTTGRSQHEDTYLAAWATVSKYKRQYAAELGVDPYSSNQALQTELNRIGWASAIANWTPSAAMASFSGGLIVAYRTFDWTETLGRVVVEEAPDTLRARNDDSMKGFGVSQPLRKHFLSHPTLSPRHQTIIVQSLESMTGALGRERFIEQCLNASSELDAFTYQQIAELLAGYHRTEAPLGEVFIYQGLPAGVTKSGTAILAYPADLGRWTRFSEGLARGFTAKSLAKPSIKRSAIWITGHTTRLAREKLKALDIAIAEDVGKRFGMMD